ncbi:MAG: portal protein [Gammaproteobacteria bacterium]
MDGELNYDDREVDAGDGKQRENVTDEAAFMQQARDCAKLAVDGWSENHTLFREDLGMVSGREHWPTEIKQEREEDGRVCLTINQLPKFVRQVLGDAKQNRIMIKVRPVEFDRGLKFKNMAGTKDYSQAEVMEGICRNIEAVSVAEQAYDLGMQYAVQGGFGWLRVIKRIARPDGFEQELVIRGVRDPYSVLYDPQAMLSDEPDFTGGMYAFAQKLVPKAIAKKKYGVDLQSIDLFNDQAGMQWWIEKDQLRLAEYFYVEEKPTTYLLLSDGRVMELDDWNKTKGQQPGVQVLKDRKGEKRCVYWSLISGLGILEGPYKWDGGYIPLAPVLGPQLWLDEGVIYESLIRHSHDAQRMYNFWRSAATEAVALAPKAPWLAADTSVAGYEKDYEAATARPVHLLKYKHRENVPPPERVESAKNPAAEIQQSLHANDDVKSTIGMFDASIGARSNETSGKAINARQREADTATFSWHDARKQAVAHIGRILVDMAPKVYDTLRIMRLKLEDDSEDFVQINYEVPGQDGKLVKMDLGTQRFDVVASAGPALGTQRQEAAESMMEFTQAIAPVAPQAVLAIADRVAQAMDWPGSDEIAKRLKKMVPPELLEAAEREELQQQAEQQGQAPPSPEQQAQLALQAKEVEAKDTEAQAKLINAQADLLIAQAKMAELQAMNPEAIKDLVAEALAEFIRSGFTEQSPPEPAPEPVAA